MSDKQARPRRAMVSGGRLVFAFGAGVPRRGLPDSDRCPVIRLFTAGSPSCGSAS